MDSLVLSTLDPALAERVEALIPDPLRDVCTLNQVPAGTDLLDFLKYEIPDLALVEAGPQRDLRPFFESVEQDPWLESVGFILLVPDLTEELFDRYRGFNIAYFLEIRDLHRTLGRVLEILSRHRDLLNHAGLLQKLTDLSGELILETDLLSINYYASLFANFLYREAYIDRDRRYAVQMVLSELLANAMEHGNAGLTYEDKSRALREGRPWHRLVEERMTQDLFKGRRILLRYQLGRSQSRFSIQDEGAGVPEALRAGRLPENVGESHGRGLYLCRQKTDSLEFNDRGNEVTAVFLHRTGAEKSVPQGFSDSRLRDYDTGDTVFLENAASDSLYYIVSGEYTVYMQGRRLTSLSPQDIFLGEMSFLLGNRRSATVVCTRPGRLSEISRSLFSETVKGHPEYGIFLSKLLARRLREANLRFIGIPEYPMHEA